MSDNLPALRPETAPEQISTNGRFSGLRSWVGSPVGRAVAQALPDVLRMANRPKPAESNSFVSQILPSSDGASGMTLSEVDVDINLPFIRRLTIRSASSWSVAPGVILAEQRQTRGRRWKLRAVAAGALSVAGVILARRSGVSLPGRLNPAASIPFLTSSSSGSTGIPQPEKNPGVAE